MKLSDLAGAKIVTTTQGNGLAGGNEMLLKPASIASEIAGVPPAVLFAKQQEKNSGRE